MREVFQKTVVGDWCFVYLSGSGLKQLNVHHFGFDFGKEISEGSMQIINTNTCFRLNNVLGYDSLYKPNVFCLFLFVECVIALNQQKL